MVKNSPANARDTDLIPGSERSPGERAWQSTPIFLLVNSMDKGASWATAHGVPKESDVT